MKWAHPARGRTTPIWGRPARWRSAPSADTAQHGAERLLGSGGDGRTLGGSGQQQPRRTQAHVLASGHLGAVHQYGQCRSEEHTSELQSRGHLVCRLLLEKKKKNRNDTETTT